MFFMITFFFLKGGRRVLNGRAGTINNLFFMWPNKVKLLSLQDEVSQDEISPKKVCTRPTACQAFKGKLQSLKTMSCFHFSI